MNSVQALRREVVRMAATGNKSACVRCQQLSGYFSLPEKRVREEIAALAEQNLIRLSSWNGHQMLAYANWPSADEFINSKLDCGHLRIEPFLTA